MDPDEFVRDGVGLHLALEVDVVAWKTQGKCTILAQFRVEIDRIRIRFRPIIKIADDPIKKADDPVKKADDPIKKADDPIIKADDRIKKADNKIKNS